MLTSDFTISLSVELKSIMYSRDTNELYSMTPPDATVNDEVLPLCNRILPNVF